MIQANRDWRRKGAVMLLTTLALVFCFPWSAGHRRQPPSFVVKARLSSACDAAALAAARNLNVGLTIDEQAASATARALAFFDANFPDGFMSSEIAAASSGRRERNAHPDGHRRRSGRRTGLFHGHVRLQLHDHQGPRESLPARCESDPGAGPLPVHEQLRFVHADEERGAELHHHVREQPGPPGAGRLWR